MSYLISIVMVSIVPTAVITKYSNRSARTEIETASRESQILKDHNGVPNCERLRVPNFGMIHKRFSHSETPQRDLRF